MNEKMSLGECAPRLRKAAEEIRAEGHPGWGNLCEETADAIDAELKARGEPVAVADVERLGHGYPTTAYPLSHPNAASMGKLYTAPPAPKIDDAMVERALTAIWRPPFDQTTRKLMRAALEAALKDTP